MTWGFALAITARAEADRSTDYSDTVRVATWDAPALRVGDLASLRGDGIFETVSVIDGQAQDVSAHLDRLAHSAKQCDLPAPNRGQWHAAVTLAARRCPPGQCSIRLLLVREPVGPAAATGWLVATVSADFTQVRQHGITVVTLERGLERTVAEHAPWLLLNAKTLSYAVNMAAIREARRRGADDAIFISSDGFVMEGPTSSVIVRLGGQYLTPDPGAGILRGTTQLRVFNFLAAHGERTRYATISADTLADAEAIWLLSSIRLAAAVTAVDGVDVSHDLAMTARLNDYLLRPGGEVSPTTRSALP